MAGKQHLSDEVVKDYLEELARHFGEPIRPVSEYCDAFREWGRAIGEKIQRDKEKLGGYPTFTEEHDKLSYDEKPDYYWIVKQLEQDVANWSKVSDGLSYATIPIMKSNYLWRLIYGDGQKRTKMCPEHKGRWSGYGWVDKDAACKYGCQHGYDITGWLPEVHKFVTPPDSKPPKYDEAGKIVAIGVTYGPKELCYHCGGTLKDGQHGSEVTSANTDD